ncbi:MAG TPA: GNAT family N-acetyltransferase [Pirellulales bacterium]|nr:GNAT family N-acetyltransferase [Pirellulales bacterium]
MKTYYVEMFAPPERAVSPAKQGFAVVYAKRPTIGYYRFLYDAVGNDWNWQSRKKLSGDALATIIHDPRNELHVLFLEGVPAGFVELDRRVEGEIEISQFGLLPEFIGQGWGEIFLRWAVDKAWSYGPKRLWLHTCTKDHPVALPNYLKAGFTIYKEEVKEDPAP